MTFVGFSTNTVFKIGERSHNFFSKNEFYIEENKIKMVLPDGRTIQFPFCLSIWNTMLIKNNLFSNINFFPTRKHLVFVEQTVSTVFCGNFKNFSLETIFEENRFLKSNSCYRPFQHRFGGGGCLPNFLF